MRFFAELSIKLNLVKPIAEQSSFSWAINFMNQSITWGYVNQRQACEIIEQQFRKTTLRSMLTDWEEEI